tara:strand:+ start:52 stop:582 length:531 start_codon:yes stop_codon:yes gene_type:complete
MRSHLIHTIFLTAIIMAVVLVAICLAETVPDAGGKPHPDYSGLQIGGDGAARLEHIGLLSFSFQCLLLIQIILLSTLGVPERYRTTELLSYMGGSLVLMLLVAWKMFFGHQAFLATQETDYFFGFPDATAWQTYGTWLSAIPLVLIYSLGFNKFIFSLEDEKKFNALLAEKNKNNR